MVKPVNSVDLPAYIVILRSIVEILDRWMVFISTKYLFGLLLSAGSQCYSAYGLRKDLLVGLVDIVNDDYGKISIITEVSQRDSQAWRQSKLINDCFGNIQTNRHAEEIAISQAKILDDS